MKRRALLCAFAWLVASALPLSAQTADEVLAQARKTYDERGSTAALPEYERALALYRASHDRRGEAITLGYIGNCYKHLGDYPRAVENLQKALTIKREVGDRLEEGKTLSHLGLLYWEMGDYPKSIELHNRSLEIARQLQHRQLEGVTLMNLGLDYDELGEYPRSLEYYQEALRVHQSSHYESGEADVLSNLGGWHQLLGRYREGAQYYEQALELYDRLKLKPSAGRALGNLGLCQLGLGKPEEAIQTFDRAISLTRDTGLRKEEADFHKARGSALIRLGKYDAARDEYRQALQVYEQAGLKRELVEALNDDGTLHAQLGDSVTAEKDFQRAIDLARSIGHPRGVTSNLLTLGDLEWRRRRYDQAAALYREAFDRAREADDRGAMATSLVSLALTLLDQGRLSEALPKARQALEIARATGAGLLEAQTLLALGELARSGGEPQKALEQYGAGEALARAASDTELGWQLAYGKGQALEALGHNDDALAAYRQAVEIIEGVRSRLREQRFRAGYLEDRVQVYVALVRLLLKMGKPGQAFVYSERLRAMSYQDLLDRAATPIADEREAELRSRIRRLQQLIDESAKPTAQQKRGALKLYTDELASAQRAYEALMDDLRASRPEAVALHALDVSTPEQVQARLPADTALIEYVLGDDSLAIFTLTRADVRAKTVSVRAADLQSKVELFRDLVARKGSRDWVKPAESLDRLLIEPIAQEGWLRNIRRLEIVPHSVLHYLPFASLVRPGGPGQGLDRHGTGQAHRPAPTVGGRRGDRGRPRPHFLVQDYELAYLPAASALVGEKETRDLKGSLLALAPARSHLLYAQEEARSVSSYFPSGSLVLLGRRATKGAFKEQSGGFKVLHLATHGFFDKFNPMFSGVELEPDAHEDGRLEVYEILRLHLNARLVTLSACETALGTGYFAEYPAGDEFVGLTRAFLSAGSSEVLASLWEVNDRSTLQFMRSFYRGLGGNQDGAALRKAQLAMLKAGRSYSQPYYWAPFVLVGVEK